MLPDVNQVLKPMKGKLHWINKIKLFSAQNQAHQPGPHYNHGRKNRPQRYGLESGIFWEMNM